MDITKINSGILRGWLKLIEKRDSLLKELQSLEKAIAKVGSGKISAPRGRRKKAGAKVSRRKSGRRRGALKAKILAALKAAGDKGVAVKDLSKKLAVKNQNIHVWFSSTGRKLGIQRIAAGRYRLKP